MNQEYAEVKEIIREKFQLQENSCYQTTGASQRPAEGIKNEEVTQSKARSKIRLGVLALGSLIILLIFAVFACFIVAFIEISEIKSEIAYLPSAPTNDQYELIIQQMLNISNDNNMLKELSRNYSSIAMRFSMLNDQYELIQQMLNISNDTLRELSQNYSALENITQHLTHVTESGLYPAASCAAILRFIPSSPSGHYWIRSSNGSAVNVYCDMTRSCGGVTGGWIRVAELDMTNNSMQCPSTLTLRTDSMRRTCGIGLQGRDCSSVTFPTDTIQYTKVCGMIKAYQFGTTDSFGDSNGQRPQNIDTYYVDGVSLTHGNPTRQHIWTFAAAVIESAAGARFNCECTDISSRYYASRPPAFVGRDYFCDTGRDNDSQSVFYENDPLWDGAGCGPQSTCCSFNSPPWFYKQLPNPTTDDIEMRVCADEGRDNEDTPIEKVILYVQ